MFPIRDNLQSRDKPIVTWTLIGLNLLVYLWDRNWIWNGESIVFLDLRMRPSEVVMALSGVGDPIELGKVFTSMFLHATPRGVAWFLPWHVPWHLLGNMLFLFVFGKNVENVLGGFRFALYFLFWGVAAAAAHVFVNPSSPIPTLGASGAIGGVLGCYLLLFPGNRVRVMIPPVVFMTFAIPAWILLGLWFVWQVLFPQAGVANWAHAGGFLAGMVTVLVIGGRTKALQGGRWKNVELEDEVV